MSKTVHTIFGPFDDALTRKLQEAYKKHKDEESFVFVLADGTPHPLLTDLVKYLLEYLTSQGLGDKNAATAGK